MTLEQIKKEAALYGYKLVKAERYTKFLPCLCGSIKHNHTITFREHQRLHQYVCAGCGRKGPWATDINKAKYAWNEMIKEEIKNAK